MQLAILLAILLSFSGVKSGASTGAPAWLVLGACLLAAPLTAFAASAWLVRGIVRDFPEHNQWIDRYESLQRVAMGVWLAAIVVAFCGCHWAAVVRDNGPLGHIPMGADLAAFAPVLGTLLLIWTAFWFVERTLCRSPLRLDTYLLSQARHFLLLPLLPVLVILAGRETLEWWSPRFSSSSLGQAIQGGGLVALLFIAPLAVRRIWNTASLAPGELRDRLLAACRAGGCQLNDILLWNTGGRMANAAILGVFPGMRYLLVTDALISDLSLKELELVLRHEGTHVGRRHLLLRLALLLAPVWCGFWITRSYPAMETGFNDSLGQFGIAGLESLLPLVAAVAYAVFALGWISHRLEFEADLGVIYLGDRDPLQFDSEHSAADASEFAAVLCRISGDIHHSSWMHPSVQKRIEFLENAARSPEKAATFRRQMNWLWRGLIAAYVAAPVISAWVLFYQ